MKLIPLSKGLEAIVDDEDFQNLITHRWCADNKGYAMRTEKRSETGKTKRGVIYMHRAILNPDKGKMVDHINGNTLDNRKSNLRLASHSENMRNRKLQKNNSTGYKGVWLNKKTGLFVASIKDNGMSRTIKRCKTAIEAAQAYNDRAREIYGEFARLNDV